jgi:hypothetical protein
MRILSTSAIALIAAASLSGSALAADVLDRQYEDKYADQPAGVHVDWSGVYVGGAIGYGLANYELEGNGFPFSFDGISGNGFQGCGIVGAQRQMGIMVAGLEGRGCGANISTGLKIGANEASFELDYSYAAYAKLGLAQDDFLVSALAGYKWQHVSLDAFNFDDTIEGFSGGLLVENKLDEAGRWNLGFEMLFTQFEEQDAVILNIDPTEYEGNIRLTYTLGR